MQKKRVVGLLVIFMTCILTTAGHSKTLLANNFIGAGFGIIKFGDDFLDDYLGLGHGLESFANINLNENFDLLLNAGYAWASGEEDGIKLDINTFGGGADLFYSFKPRSNVNPFVSAGFTVVKSEVEISSSIGKESWDSTDTGVGGGVGVELEFSEEVIFRYSLNYFHIDSEDSVDVSAGAGYWFSNQFLGWIEGSYDFESKDAIALLGIMYKP